ncbi:MAG: TadE/TadG family type IV pilus assembly protein [Litorimonas sp.]
MSLVSVKSTQKFSARNLCNTLSPRRLSQRYREDERGIAAIEFAIIAPIMIGMYFGLAEIASAISVDRRISHGTNVAGDLATQQPELKDDDIEEVLSAALRVMEVPDGGQVSIDMESFILPSEGAAPESRGRIRLNSSVGNFSDFDASTLDIKLLNSKSGVVVTRVKYNYTPLELRYFDSTVKLEETFLLKPRRSDAVDFQDGNGSVVDCTASSYATVSCSITASP